MDMQDLLLAGAELMLLGMGIVFGFLIILVFVLRGMSALASKFETPHAAPAGGVQPASAAPAGASGDDTLIAVIAAAVHRYRGKQQ